MFVGCLLDVFGIFVRCLWVFDDTHSSLGLNLTRVVGASSVH